MKTAVKILNNKIINYECVPENYIIDMPEIYQEFNREIHPWGFNHEEIEIGKGWKKKYFYKYNKCPDCFSITCSCLCYNCNNEIPTCICE